ncbi:MAG: alpha/beta hydrolase [Candidatus Dojkabacteria bacterium]
MRTDYKIKTFDYFDKQITAYEFGDGDIPVLALPSFPFSGSYYLIFLKNYSKANIRLITFDIPGWIGRSENLFDEYNRFKIDKVCSLSLRVLEEFGIDQANIIGYSLGGMIGLRLAAENPARFKKLVLVSSVFNGELVAKHGLTSKLGKLMLDMQAGYLIRQFILARFNPVAKLIEAEGTSQLMIREYRALLKNLDTEVVLDTLRELFDSDYTHYLDEINSRGTKVAVVNSKDEPKMFRKQAELIRRKLDGEHSIYLSGTHNDFILKSDSKAVADLIGFLISDKV